MRFPFEYLSGDDRWETVGVGRGDGERAAVDAFTEMAREGEVAGFSGTYRYSLPGPGERWGFLEVDAEGNVTVADRPNVP